MTKMKQMLLLGTGILTLTSCSNDDDIPPIINEEEVITTVIAQFTNGGETVTLTSYDEDGDGPGEPEITVDGNFTAGETYSGTLRFVNQSVTPAEEITNEIQEESDEHQIFFQQSGLGTFTYNDQDENGNPLGLSFTFTSSLTPASGNLTITLIHEPDKFAEGVSGGNIENAGGSTDAEVVFPVIVE
jgi:hypothetical protein